MLGGIRARAQHAFGKARVEDFFRFRREGVLQGDFSHVAVILRRHGAHGLELQAQHVEREAVGIAGLALQAAQQVAPVVVRRVVAHQVFHGDQVGGRILAFRARVGQQLQFFDGRRLARLLLGRHVSHQFLFRAREIIAEVIGADDVGTHGGHVAGCRLVTGEPFDGVRVIFGVVVVVGQRLDEVAFRFLVQLARFDDRFQRRHGHRRIVGGRRQRHAQAVQHERFIRRQGRNGGSLVDAALHVGVVFGIHRCLHGGRIEQLEYFRAYRIGRGGGSGGGWLGILRVRQGWQDIEADGGQEQAKACKTELGHGLSFNQ
ncbi:hypothetical protein D3C72_1353950 [compost metagenome]